jgi:hypothetical protein
MEVDEDERWRATEVYNGVQCRGMAESDGGIKWRTTEI